MWLLDFIMLKLLKGATATDPGVLGEPIELNSQITTAIELNSQITTAIEMESTAL